MPSPCRGGWFHGVCQDDANVNIINPVPQRIVAWSSQGGRHQRQHHPAGPGGMELAGMPPCAEEDDEDMELARMTSIINIIKLVSRRTEAWSSRDDSTDVYLVKMEPAVRSHEDDTRPRCCP